MIRTILEGKKAVIFDLDGTLVDSMWMWKAIDVEYLGRFGQECPSDLQKAIEGMSFTETALYFKERFKLPCTIQEIKDDWTRMSIEKYRSQVPLKEGAREFLTELARRGLPMGIATSNGREMADAVLESQNIKDFFANVTIGCEVAKGKPSPDIYLKVAEHLKVPPCQCLVFEDIPAGIRAGKAAGMTVVAVDDVFSRGMRVEKAALADYFIESYLELTGGSYGAWD